MTVLVVVLLCMFAAIQRPPPPPQPGPTGGTGPTGGSGLPKTLEEFEAEVLVNRRKCVLKSLRAEAGKTFNDSFQIRLCSFTPGSAGSESPDACLAALQTLNETSDHTPSFDSLEAVYSVRFGRLYLRANTGLGSADSDILKKRLNEAQEYLKGLRAGPLGRFELQLPEYTEQGSANRASDMTVGINVELAADLRSMIQKLWEAKHEQDLKDLLRMSAVCQRIPK
jgi:hypothetical protein